MDNSFIILFIAVFFLAFAPFYLFAVRPFVLWLQAILSGVNIQLLEIIFMEFRKVSAKKIVTCLIAAKQAEVELDTVKLQAHYLAGGDVVKLTQALIAAKRAGVEVDYMMLAGVNLAEGDVFETVREKIAEKVTA